MLDSDKQRDIYRRLWAYRFEDKPLVPVKYRVATLMPDGSSAYFFREFPQGRRCLGIWVGRAHEILPAPDARTEPDLVNATLPELIALAHERGHEISEHRKLYLPRRMEEERRAWKQAREDILDPMGFTEWDTFARLQELDLEEHIGRRTPE